MDLAERLPQRLPQADGEHVVAPRHDVRHMSPDRVPEAESIPPQRATVEADAATTHRSPATGRPAVHEDHP